MKDRLTERLKDLNAEFESGQQLLADLEGKATHVRSSLLRIRGAIQVLEELLQTEKNTSCEQPSSVSTNGVAASSHAS